MKLKLGVFFFCVSLFAVVQGQATVLPDACGADNVKFDVKTQKNPPAPAPPAAGKAQIVFIENENTEIGPFMYATVRFGLDGAWAGADNNNSYFTVLVDPGVHHLCASWQSSRGMLQKYVDVASFTAAPGKVYYFAANVKITGTGNGGMNIHFKLARLKRDAGMYRVKAWKLATSTPDK